MSIYHITYHHENDIKFQLIIIALFFFYSYSIDRKTDEHKQFNIDQNGLVTVAGALDRETTPVHRIHILAIDKGKDFMPACHNAMTYGVYFRRMIFGQK